MDADRRRKTVIAGTFAIVCKSLSNAQPINADRSQRTKAEMTMASTHVPTLHEAHAEGIYARVANQVFHSVDAVEARPHLRTSRSIGGGGGSISEFRYRRAGRENPDRRNGAGETIARQTLKSPRPDFVFRPKFSEA
jgi:hypothetical protein